MKPVAQAFYRDVALKHSGDECLLWPYATNGIGYGRIGNKLVHRLVCEHFHGSPPSLKSEAAHLCGNRLCCSHRHLEWKSHAENIADKKTHGTATAGESHGTSKLTENEVRRIRELAGVTSQRAIARMFGVNQGTISDIVRRESWGHV